MSSAGLFLTDHSYSLLMQHVLYTLMFPSMKAIYIPKRKLFSSVISTKTKGKLYKILIMDTFTRTS